MKYTTLLYVLAVLVSISALAAETGSDSSIPDVTVKRHVTKDSDGTVLATTDMFYRGTNRILDVVTYEKTHGAYSVGGGWRTYRMGGAPVLIEDRKRPDGDVELRVFGKSSDLTDFEEFTRHSDGSVRPVTKEELWKLKEQTKKDEAVAQTFLGIVEHSINTHTNAADVVKDLKQKAEQLKQLQDKMPDEKNK